MLIVFILFICFLLALGYFFSGNAIAFTVKSLVALGAIAFVVLAGVVIWALNPSPHTASTNTQSVTTTAQPDPFPFYDDSQQYAWYDRNNVPMSNRCYTTMTTPCSALEWQQALGVTLTPAQQQTINQQWCEKFAAQWNETVDQCIANAK
jgi:hypothetical protein